MKNTVIQRTLMLLTLILSGCGAGGNVDPIPTTGVSITRFLGVWHNNNPDPVCQQQNGIYYSEGQMRLTGESYIETFDFYSDSNCVNYLGSINNIFNIEWSIPTSTATKTDAMRAIIYSPQYTASGAILPPAVASDPSISYKALFYVDSSGLSSYFDVVTPSNLLDTEGYPLGDGQPLFTYSR